jgi:hypothetical protein
MQSNDAVISVRTTMATDDWRQHINYTCKSLVEIRGEIMIRKPHIRRPVAVLLMLLGASLIFLTLETWTGILVFALGVFIEAAGIAYSHKE